MKTILVKSKVHGDRLAIVDDEDFEHLNRLTWWRGGPRKEYAYTTIYKNGIPKNYPMHRMVMGFPKKSVDHKNTDGFDNRKMNLRTCTHKQNCANRKKRKDNKTGFKGVVLTKNKQKFIAQIRKSTHNIYIGVYSSAIEAAKAYNEVVTKLHGEFANLNQIPCAESVEA